MPTKETVKGMEVKNYSLRLQKVKQALNMDYSEAMNLKHFCDRRNRMSFKRRRVIQPTECGPAEFLH
jgi:hypothetical protein